MNCITKCCCDIDIQESPKLEVIDSNGKPIRNRPLERVKRTDSIAVKIMTQHGDKK